MSVFTSSIPFADTTEQQAHDAETFVNGVELHIQKDATAADVYVQLFDDTSVTPGTTVPDTVLYVSSADIARGRFLFRWNFTTLQFPSGLEVFVSTTPTGATASTIVGSLRVFYNPGGPGTAA